MKTIEDWRKAINDIDDELLVLLNRRATCAQSIGEIKARSNIAVDDPVREQAIFERLRMGNTGPLSDDALTRIFTGIITELKLLE